MKERKTYIVLRLVSLMDRDKKMWVSCHHLQMCNFTGYAVAFQTECITLSACSTDTGNQPAKSCRSSASKLL